MLVFLSFLVPNHLLFANFSQFPPISANFHLYSTILDLLPQLFHLYDLGVVWCSPFENIPFWLYFLSPFVNFNFFCGRLIDFVYIFVIYLDFFCISAQTLEKKFPWKKYGIWAKILRQFLILLINRHS